MNIAIREARETEIDTLLEFEQCIVDIERTFENSLRNGEIHYYNLLEFIKSDKAVILVAVCDNEIIGSGYAKILPAKDYYKFEYYAYVGFMYVKPSFRGKGVNALIIDNLIKWSKSKNITEVRLQVYDENIPAKNAYLKAGFKPNFLEMRLDIS